MESLIKNYIYLYHTDQFVLLPTYPESVTNTLNSSFNEAQPLSRSAPIYSYIRSGPRTIQVTLALHRDMMQMLNYNTSNFNLEIGEDYIDVLIKQLQSIALPRYASGTKLIDPPLIAIRFGDDLFMKGIINGGITTTLSGPILETNKYAQVNISFQVSEVDPYDAITIQRGGLFSGSLNKTLERRLYK